MLKLPNKYIDVTDRSEMEVKKYLYDMWKSLEKHPNSISGNINGIEIVMFHE